MKLDKEVDEDGLKIGRTDNAFMFEAMIIGLSFWFSRTKVISCDMGHIKANVQRKQSSENNGSLAHVSWLENCCYRNRVLISH